MYIGQIFLVKKNEWITTREFTKKSKAEEWIEMLTTGFYPLSNTDVRIICR